MPLVTQFLQCVNLESGTWIGAAHNAMERSGYEAAAREVVKTSFLLKLPAHGEIATPAARAPLAKVSTPPSEYNPSRLRARPAPFAKEEGRKAVLGADAPPGQRSPNRDYVGQQRAARAHQAKVVGAEDALGPVREVSPGFHTARSKGRQMPPARPLQGAQAAEAETFERKATAKAQAKYERQAAQAEASEREALLKAQPAQRNQVANAEAAANEAPPKAQATRDEQAPASSTQIESQKGKHAEQAQGKFETRGSSAADAAKRCQELPKRDAPCALCDSLFVQKCMRRLQAWPPVRLLHDRVDPITGKPPEDPSRFLYDAAFMPDQPHAPLEVLFPVPQSGMSYL